MAVTQEVEFAASSKDPLAIMNQDSRVRRTIMIYIPFASLACRQRGCADPDRSTFVTPFCSWLLQVGYYVSSMTAAAALKATLLAKRAARSRFQYLRWSYGAAALLIGLLFVASAFYPVQAASNDLLLAVKAGLIGAAFSIALAIRGRTVALDTDRLDKRRGQGNGGVPVTLPAK